MAFLCGLYNSSKNIPNIVLCCHISSVWGFRMSCKIELNTKAVHTVCSLSVINVDGTFYAALPLQISLGSIRLISCLTSLRSSISHNFFSWISIKSEEKIKIYFKGKDANYLYTYSSGVRVTSNTEDVIYIFKIISYMLK